MRKTFVLVVECLVVIAIGIGALLGLSMLREEPAVSEPELRPIRVEVTEVQPEDLPVTVTGYGSVRPLDVVVIAPEVSGRIIEKHPRLEVGEVIPEGETLFIIDPRQYQARVDDARANIEMLKAKAEQLRIRQSSDRERLKTLERTRDLARGDFERMRDLFVEERVGAKVKVELAEQAYNQAQDAVDQMAQSLKVYPQQAQEIQSNLESAQANLEVALLNLERTAIEAPFNARIKSQSVELNQTVAAGTPVATLADDSLLEITVPLDSREARDWLQFGEAREAESAWFAPLEPVACELRWTEDEQRTWTGVLDRVQNVDEQTRTVTVAVRIPAENALSNDDEPTPLVEGMFCEVRIPGKTMHDVYRVPRSAINFDSTVYLAEDGKLETTHVNIAHEQENEAFLSTGLAPGDLVILTRLVNPFEGAVLDVVRRDDAGEAAS